MITRPGMITQASRRRADPVVQLGVDVAIHLDRTLCQDAGAMDLATHLENRV